MVINQAMKRQPMAVYRIRNVLTGYRKSPLPALNFSNNLLASHSPSAATNRRSAQSLTDEVELPVEEFMGTTFRPESIQRFRSVPADIHYTLEDPPTVKAHGDESILQDLPDNKWVGTKVVVTTNSTADLDVQPSPESHDDEETNKPDQNKLGMSVPELDLASMRNSSNKIDTNHNFSCDNIVNA